MKNKIRQAIKIISFCLILALSLKSAYSVISWKDGVGGYSSALNTLKKLENNTVDVLFLGSSHSYCGVNPSLLYDKYGIACFGSVISGQDIASSYYCLEQTYKTQSPKIVFVELYSALFEKHMVESNIYRNTLSFPFSLKYPDIVNSIAPEENKNDYLLKWPIIHTRYKELKKYDFIEPEYDFMGHIYNVSSTEIEPLPKFTTTETLPLYDGKEHWIQKIIDLAKNNGSDVYFFLTPFDIDENTYMQVKYAENMLKEQNITLINFYDMIDELGIDFTVDFLDSGHLSSYGAEKITNYLGQYIKSNYNIPNRKGDEKYGMWERDLLLYNNAETHHELTQTTEIKTYLSLLNNLEGHTVVICTYGEHIYPDTDISKELSDLEITQKSFSEGGVWILSDGEIVFESDEDNFTYHYSLGRSDMVIRSNDEERQIIVDRNTKRHVDNGIAILVYDNEFNSIADYINFNAADKYRRKRYN